MCPVEPSTGSIMSPRAYEALVGSFPERRSDHLLLLLKACR